MEMGALVVKTGRRAGRALLDQLYPPACLACDAPLGDAGGLCAVCFGRLRPITAPLCPVMGLPFTASLGPGALSAEAIADPPPFGRARAAVVYGELARALVARLKYGDRPELAAFCARLMAQAGAELWEGEPVLAPVPLHPLRLFSRRYNQSTELARMLGRLTGLKVATGLVARRKNTRPQVGLSGTARRRNLAGAFVARPEAVLRLAGRRVVIVDDVITTGATVRAVSRALLEAGVAAVDVVSFARVVVGEDG